MLGQADAHLVVLALELVRRDHPEARLPPGFAVLFDRCRLAADGCDLESTCDSSPRPDLASEERITVSEAAKIRQCSPQAIRSMARAGKFGAARHGHVWSLIRSQVEAERVSRIGSNDDGQQHRAA
jgi:hypothetical protein